MQLKIHPVLRFVIGAAIMALYFFSLVEWNWFDPIIIWSPIAAYLITAITGSLCAAVLYGLLPTKKTIKTTITALNDSGKKDRVIGYWTWILCGVVFFVIWLPIYINEM